MRTTKKMHIAGFFSSSLQIRPEIKPDAQKTSLFLPSNKIFAEDAVSSREKKSTFQQLSKMAKKLLPASSATATLELLTSRKNSNTDTNSGASTSSSLSSDSKNNRFYSLKHHVFSMQRIIDFFDFFDVLMLEQQDKKTCQEIKKAIIQLKELSEAIANEIPPFSREDLSFESYLNKVERYYDKVNEISFPSVTGRLSLVMMLLYRSQVLDTLSQTYLTYQSNAQGKKRKIKGDRVGFMQQEREKALSKMDIVEKDIFAFKEKKREKNELDAFLKRCVNNISDVALIIDNVNQNLNSMDSEKTLQEVRNSLEILNRSKNKLVFRIKANSEIEKLHRQRNMKKTALIDLRNFDSDDIDKNKQLKQELFYLLPKEFFLVKRYDETYKTSFLNDLDVNFSSFELGMPIVIWDDKNDNDNDKDETLPADLTDEEYKELIDNFSDDSDSDNSNFSKTSCFSRKSSSSDFFVDKRVSEVENSIAIRRDETLSHSLKG